MATGQDQPVNPDPNQGWQDYKAPADTSGEWHDYVPPPAAADTPYQRSFGEKAAGAAGDALRWANTNLNPLSSSYWEPPTKDVPDPNRSFVRKTIDYLNPLTNKPWEGSWTPRTPEELLSGFEMLGGEIAGSALGSAGSALGSAGKSMAGKAGSFLEKYAPEMLGETGPTIEPSVVAPRPEAPTQIPRAPGLFDMPPSSLRTVESPLSRVPRWPGFLPPRLPPGYSFAERLNRFAEGKTGIGGSGIGAAPALLLQSWWLEAL